MWKDIDSIDWAEVFARLHPLLLHLPVGLFVALAWLQFWRLFRRSVPAKDPTRSALVALLALSTPLAAASGWFLHEGGGYPAPVTWHERGGIALAVLSWIVAGAYMTGARAYGALVWLGLLLLIPTAHLGGTLTHGEGFLLDPLREDTSPAEARPVLTAEPVEPGAESLAGPEYADVLPIFERLCTRCHGQRKQRGGLALHSAEALQAGGDSGPVISAREPAASLLLQHLLLPLDADEHMPPANKTQPTEGELDLLQAFVLGQPRPDVGERAPELTASAAPLEQPVEARTEPEADPLLIAKALEKLRTRLVHVQALAPNNEALWLDFAASEPVAGELRELLEPLSTLLAEVSLAGKSLAQGDLDFLGGLPALLQLDLRRVPLRELDLAGLAASSSIQSLNLAGAPLAAASLDLLIGMDPLQRVDLWGTGLEQRADEMRVARPQLVVNLGSEPSVALDTEPEVLFERPANPAQDSAITPLNGTCPVTGSAVDARYVIEHEGRRIGFCCSNCPKAFWDDPTTFLTELDEQD